MNNIKEYIPISNIPEQRSTSFQSLISTCEKNYDISKQDKKIPSDSLYRDIDTNRGNSLFDTDVIDEYF